MAQRQEILTRWHRYSLYDVASALQKSIRRGDWHAASLPDNVYDCHTIQGKIRGKTKAQFFIEEERALTNKQPSLFDINELMK